jgi:hypothetical protein
MYEIDAADYESLYAFSTSGWEEKPAILEAARLARVWPHVVVRKVADVVNVTVAEWEDGRRTK